MAFTPQSNLTWTGDPGLVAGNLVNLRDYQHAAKLFNVDQFRLAPKHSFLFHVSFGINTRALSNSQLVSTYGQEINMLVKSIDLPSFTIQTEILNQYNRKKVVQQKVSYGELSVKFHDDNMGLINQLWQEYFAYYYADSNTSTIPGAYSRNATKSYSSIPANYGFDAGSTDPFFNYIKIYQMARHEYVCYHLYNPLITSWNHNKLDYSQNTLRDFDMKLQYESVSYDVGSVQADSPEGFGVTHYDTTPSPLTGSIPAGTSEASFVSSIDTTGLAAGALSHALAQVNTYQNSQQSSGINAVASGLAIGAGIAGVLGATGALSALASGLSGISFPSLKGSDSVLTNEDQGGDPLGSSQDENSTEGDDPSNEENSDNTSQETSDDETDTTADPNPEDTLTEDEPAGDSGDAWDF